jgi:curved DNA-binding protein CbpA
VSDSSTTAKEATFEVPASVDITALPLTPEEGFVISRLMGRRRGVADLTRETGLPPADVKRHVESLVTDPRRRLPYDGMIFSLADLADGPDLNDEQKRRILHVEANLAFWNHYKLLGLRRTASAEEIKSAYFKLSREFHPDTFFRKNIGRYAERVDRIFRALKTAHDVLSKPGTREAYDVTLVGDFSPEELAELEKIASAKKLEAENAARLARNDAARKAARLRWNPVAQRMSRGAEIFQLAEEARKAGRLEEAVTHARLACSYDDSLQGRAEGIFEEADIARANAMLKRVEGSIRYIDKSNEEELLRAADAVLELAEKLYRVTLLLGVARVMLALKRPQKAFRAANLATEKEPQNVKAWEVVADAAVAEGKWALATRAAEKWQALDPTAMRPKELIKQARAR